MDDVPLSVFAFVGGPIGNAAFSPKHPEQYDKKVSNQSRLYFSIS